MAGTPGRTAFEGYLNAAGVDDALPWSDQDQRAWEKAASGVKTAPAEEAGDDEQPTELRLDAAHEEG